MTDEVDARLRAMFDHLPGLWGCKDENSVFMYANARYGEAVGVRHHLDIIGRTDFDMPCDTVACAPLFRAQDMEVMDSVESLRVLDVHHFAGGEWRAFLFTKTPMLDKDGRVAGTIFHGADITSANTIELGSLLGRVCVDVAHGDLIDQGSYIIGSDRGAIKLTTREAEVLFFMIRGKNAKSVAGILKMSPRTVEHHIAAMKGKFSERSRIGLIERAISLGYLNYIPDSLFRQQLSLTLRSD
jgi:DNA-binding CsgD family transcriptional regulator